MAGASGSRGRLLQALALVCCLYCVGFLGLRVSNSGRPLLYRRQKNLGHGESLNVGHTQLREQLGGNDTLLNLEGAGELRQEQLIFHSYDVFERNYGEMATKFKVFAYPDGDPHTYFRTPRKLSGKYASEGYFFKNIMESSFVTLDADEADLFFLPISCHKMRGKGMSYDKMAQIVQEYVESLIMKYPYWNKTLGADHFFVTCHDVGVRATSRLAHLVKNSIRVVCSPSHNGSFIPHKDVALPQVFQPFPLPPGGDDIASRLVS